MDKLLISLHTNLEAELSTLKHSKYPGIYPALQHTHKKTSYTQKDLLLNVLWGHVRRAYIPYKVAEFLSFPQMFSLNSSFVSLLQVQHVQLSSRTETCVLFFLNAEQVRSLAPQSRVLPRVARCPHPWKVGKIVNNKYFISSQF